MKLDLKPLAKPAILAKSMSNNRQSIDRQIKASIDTFTELTERANHLNENAGTGSDAFKEAIKTIQQAIKQDQELVSLIDSRLMVRALAFTLIKEKTYKKAKVGQALLEKIDEIRQVPSSLFVRYMLLFYFNHYDELYDTQSLAQWLKEKTFVIKEFRHLDPKLFKANGAKWLAEESIRSKREFHNQIKHLNLKNYQSGRFLFVAQNIYYIEQLKEIKVNQPHDLLRELQKPDVFNARYDTNSLLGHEVLRILIQRAPDNDIDDSWRNVVMAIAGDPRVPKTDKRYQTWWSQIDRSLIQKVIGWLSGFDLRLFLEALENFSQNSSDEQLQRMFPARKQFLQGLLDKKCVTGVRLYLTPKFTLYLQKHYQKEHLPKFSTVDGDTSIIYVQLGKTHLIEGSHSCKLWIYRGLPQDALVFNNNNRSASYSALTSGMGSHMKDAKGEKLLIDTVVHHPHLTWQNKAIAAINQTDVKIHPRDVLTEADYQDYKRKFDIDYEY